jgi:hypothetical protein
MESGFENLATFFEDRPLNDFQARVKDAIWAFSRGAASLDVSERLIFAVAAAETLFSADASENLQTTVADRLAFMVATTASERRAVVANYKRAYGLRSKFIHHQVRVRDEAVLTEFYGNVFKGLFRALTGIRKCPTHSNFIEYLENLKFG